MINQRVKKILLLKYIVYAQCLIFLSRVFFHINYSFFCKKNKLLYAAIPFWNGETIYIYIYKICEKNLKITLFSILGDTYFWTKSSNLFL